MKVSAFVSVLFHSRTQAHIFHLGTKKYSTHKALDNYYSSIIPLVDSFVEAYQGKNGTIKGYSSPKIINVTSDQVIIKYFKSLVKNITKFKVKDSYLQNLIDSIVELLYSTIYQLSLK